MRPSHDLEGLKEEGVASLLETWHGAVLQEANEPGRAVSDRETDCDCAMLGLGHVSSVEKSNGERGIEEGT